MLLQPIKTEGENAVDEFMTIDGVGSGVGDMVLCIAEGGSVSQVYRNEKAPINMVIAGIVDIGESEEGCLTLT